MTTTPTTFFVDRSDRVRLAVTGPDRAKFLHNLTTNDIKRLPVGQGVEAFVTSPQGKTLGYVTILAEADRILVRADPGGDQYFLPHLQKYGIFDDVTLDDVSARTFEFHLAGIEAIDIAGRVGLDLYEPGDLNHVVANIAGATVLVIRETPIAAHGLTLIGELASAPAIRASLQKEGIADLDAESAEACRIAIGTPRFGLDVTPENLPQEIARDSRAINFVKGCYLGQETVARIDALGHVNKLLRGLHFDTANQAPPVGSEIFLDDKPVGKITSSAFAAILGFPVALGYVRSPQVSAGMSVVVPLPDGSRLSSIVTDFS